MKPVERRKALAQTVDDVKKRYAELLAPDSKKPVEQVAFWQAIYELADTNRWETANQARSDGTPWGDIGAALNTTGDSARQILRNKSQR